ncbi:MAG: anthranilate synthase component I family protein [Phycisphaerae bacterium]
MSEAWITRTVPWPEDLPAVVRVWGADSELAWLDSPPTSGANWSLLAREPIAVLEQLPGHAARLSSRRRTVIERATGWGAWREAFARLRHHPPLPYGLSPGWIGFVAFEAARQLERLPATRVEDLGMPLLRLGLFDACIVLDHRRREAFAVAAPDIRSALGEPPLDFVAFVRSWVAAGAAVADRAAVNRSFAPPRVTFETPRAEHERRVRQAIEYIRAGDIYQVNLAHRIRIDGLPEALAVHLRLRAASAAQYAALLRWAGGAVVSTSPELLVRLRERDVLTQPIKGTRPRSGDPLRDEAARRELLGSAKDAAELAMIVDVHRNDLGRVCEPGSVIVARPRRVESLPTVFHTVADVSGVVRAGCDPIDVLAACFPAGSISGAPKIRAIEIIDELESAARGVYTGVIGALGLDGNMSFSVAIRTLQMRGPSGVVWSGGGIVADSDPSAEYDETLAKARGILDGLGASWNVPHVACEWERR